METKIKFMFVDGRKQSPQDLDFHINPVLTFSRSGKETNDVGKAWGMCIEWGHWAIGFGVFSAFITFNS